jgi:hypothetical protein
LLDAIQEQRKTEPFLLSRELATEFGLDPAEFSRFCSGRRRIPLKLAETISNRLCPGNKTRQQELAMRLRNGFADDTEDEAGDARVLTLSYGHLLTNELSRPILRSGSFTGPTGLLIDCFRRFADFAGEKGLQPRERITLRGVLTSNRPNDVSLGNIATISRIRSSYFFCTPMSVGNQGLISTDGKGPAEHALISHIRAILLGRAEDQKRTIAPIYMRDEIGSYIVRSLLNNRRSVAMIDDLSVEEYARTLNSSSVAAHQRRVLLVDELTCLLTLKQCDPQEVALLYKTPANVPRFPFGFSITRNKASLIKWLEPAWELYLRTDSTYIAERYLVAYRELVSFAKGLRDCEGITDEGKKPEAWASRVMGLETTTVGSMLVSAAWEPIINQVRAEIKG